VVFEFVFSFLTHQVITGVSSSIVVEFEVKVAKRSEA
jgi:hypothetical protein